MTRPLAFRISSTAAAKAAPSGPLSAAAMALMPLRSASSVRKADCTAGLVASVPGEFAINDFEVGMRLPLLADRHGQSCSP
jgi:hypothetical protein